MKQAILQKYSDLGEKSHLHVAPQVKAYLASGPEMEKVEEEDKEKEIINLPFPGNATYNFESRLKDEDMQPISISYMSFVNQIRKIDFQFNKLSDKGIAILSKLLAFADGLTYLNLKGNMIGDNGCKEISNALIEKDNEENKEGGEQKKKKKIEYLNLNTNNFSNFGLMELNRLIFKNPTLTYLDVGCNRYDWDGIIAVTSAIKTSNETLKVLIMDDPAYKVQDQHFFEHFGDMLAENPDKKGGLERLSLRMNKIRWEAVMIIFEKLYHNKYLKVLDLSGNQIDFQGAIYLKKFLMEDRIILQSLNLAHNKLFDRGAIILAEGLATNSNLIHLDITSNQIHDEGMEYLAKQLMENKGIQSLKLFWENEFGTKSIAALKELLKYKKDQFAEQGKEFYPDFVIEQDYHPDIDKRELKIGYLETHIENEEFFNIPK
ncbi:MAG: hypothetical protein MJ252_12290 [archaeon]|nr:hypothetical protein [archaeon]